MRTNCFVLLTALVACCLSATAQKKGTAYSSKQIIIAGQVPPGYEKDSIEINTFPVEIITYQTDEKQTIFEKVGNGSTKWVIPANKPLVTYGAFFERSVIGYRLEPGDSVYIQYQGKEPVFSGKAAAKYQLVHTLEKLEDSLEATALFKDLPTKHQPVRSLQDYLNLNTYLNQKSKLSLEILKAYQPKVSSFILNSIKEKVLYEIEIMRVIKFRSLCARSPGPINKDIKPEAMINHFGLTNRDLCAIYDSTLHTVGAHWLQYEAPLVGDPYYLYEMTGVQVKRKAGEFFRTAEVSDALKKEVSANQMVARYHFAKENYTGIRREEVLAFMFHYVRGFIYQAGFVPPIEGILADYYKQSSYPAYKTAVREYERYKRDKFNRRTAGAFTLTDINGQAFTQEHTKGKLVIMDFWFTGCKGCVVMTPALRNVEETFKGEKNVIFLSISTDEGKERWLKSIGEKKYTTGTGVNVYTGGKGDDHDMIKGYGIDGYPTLILIDATGKLIIEDKNKVDPRNDNGKGLIEVIKKQLILMKDGPYVFHEADKSKSFYFTGDAFTDKDFTQSAPPTLSVQTDSESTFTVSLKKTLQTEPTEFPAAEKLLALSDIEGNFGQFRKLLQANKIIDDQYNWTFGNGHLVFAGDMFDRGKQVTECLWLIYSLEEKAKAAGGYVHFILGNHEIMNLQGDHRYVEDKYKQNADRLDETYKYFYTQKTELGRWLRTKNVVEKIGSLLFAHGGISSKINQSNLTISRINELARPWYDQAKNDYKDQDLNLVMSTGYGPFWYRGYYANLPITKLVDSILQKFDVQHIVTGHTIVADTISTHYNNKVINTDTRHAKGMSEALLVEGDYYYRVNTEGKKVLLFIDDKRKTTQTTAVK